MKKLAFILSIGILFFLPKQVFAHVLIKDVNTNVGAILHINPDDDPVAGQNTQLYFDIQDKNARFRAPYAAYQLFVTDEKGQTSQLKLTNNDNTLAANYTFPTRGAYRLTLSSGEYSKSDKVELNYTLQIFRGTGSSSSSGSSLWTGFCVVIGVAALALASIAIVAAILRNKK